MHSLKGTVVSPGIAIGQAFVYRCEKPAVIRREIDDPEKEIQRFHRALHEAKAQIEEIRAGAVSKVGEDTAAIFEAHEMFLEDPELIGQVEAEIRSGNLNAEYAVQQTIEAYASVFSSMEDEYMRARGADVMDVGQRLLRILTGSEEVSLAQLDSPVIVIAHDLTPSDTARMNRSMVLGFITEAGGPTSHTAIMARILNIPAIVGLGPIMDEVRTGATVILDGGAGLLIVEPDDDTLSRYRLLQGKDLRRRARMKESSSLPAVGTAR